MKMPKGKNNFFKFPNTYIKNKFISKEIITNFLGYFDKPIQGSKITLVIILIGRPTISFIISKIKRFGVGFTNSCNRTMHLSLIFQHIR